MVSAKRYWNNKHPKHPIIYNGRGIRGQIRPLAVDVRRMVWHQDEILKQCVNSNGLKKKTHDATAHACQKYIVQNYKYVSDKISADMDEFWQFPNETLATMQGDCEDCSILMASLMLNAGIPDWRVRVTAGLVQTAATASTGGHAYVTYCRESDNNWVVLDWCYFEDSRTPVAKKARFSHKKKYKDIWFSFNHLYSWSHKKILEVNGLKHDPRED